MLLLEWIDTLGLLPPDPSSAESSDVLLELFSEAGRRTIVLEAVSQISGPQRQTIIAGLTSWSRVSALLDLLGPALSLGLEDLQAIGKVVELYLEWLSGSNRPPAITNTGLESTFVSAIIKQLSLLFRVRRIDQKASVAQVQVGKQAELCRHVLRAFITLASRQEEQQINLATWKVLMLVMLGISDSLLRLPLLPPCQLADDLTSELLSSLIEVWLRSRSLSSSLWSSFKTYYRRWCHRLAAVSQWTAVSLALTQRISKHLYGQGTEAVVYAVNGLPISLEGLGRQFELFAWKQHLGAIGEPAELPPANCLRATLGIELLLQVFYAVGQTGDPNSAPIEKQFPDGNTLLSLFGRWLFDAASIKSQEYVECCAHATGILCRLFSKPQSRSPFHPGYLHQFYQVLDQALKQPSSILVTVFICINCEDLLTSRLEAVRVLSGGFLMALRRLVPKPQVPLQLNIRMEDLRRACYKLLLTLFAYSSHFGGEIISLPGPVQPSNPYSEELLKTFPASEAKTAFQFAVIDTLISCLLGESDSGNQRYLLNSLTACSIDAATLHPGLATLWAKILAELLGRSDNTADTETATVALQSLQALLPLELPNDQVSSVIIPSLCDTVTPLAQPGKEANYDLLSLAVDIMVGWATYSPAATLNSDSVHRLMRTIEQLFMVDQSKSGLAQLALMRLMAQLGPEFSDSPLSISSPMTEFDFIDRPSNPEEASNDLHYFILNGSTLACFVEKTSFDENGEEQLSLVLVLRTPTGRYVWQAHPLFEKESDELVLARDSDLKSLWREFKNLNLCEKKKHIEPFVPDPNQCPIYNDEIFNRQLEKDDRRLKNLTLISDLCKKQQKEMDAERLVDSPAHVSPPYVPKANASQRGKLTRLLLAHFGFLVPSSSWFLQPVPTCSRLLSQIQTLDSLPEREVLSVSVFFVRSGLQSLAEILTERRISNDFVQFINSLGWPIENNMGDGEELGKTVPYFCDKSVELLYQVPPIFPRFSGKADEFDLAGHIGSIIAENTVAIVWLEDPQDLLSLPSKFGCPNTLIYLCIIPMVGAGSTGLYRVRIMVTAAPVDQNGTTAAFTFGPLLDGMVIRREALGRLVRTTAISASLFCRYHLSQPTNSAVSPVAARAKHIISLAQKYATVDSNAALGLIDNIYSALLFPLNREPAPLERGGKSPSSLKEDSDSRFNSRSESRPEVFGSSADLGERDSASAASAGMVSYITDDVPVEP